MKNDHTGRMSKLKSRFWISTIKYHDLIVAHIRIYMFAGVAFILLLGLGGFIHIQTALYSILFGGLAILILLWMLLEVRRSHLFQITDPVLKQKAYDVMLEFIYRRRHKIEKKSLIWNKILKKIRV